VWISCVCSCFLIKQLSLYIAHAKTKSMQQFDRFHFLTLVIIAISEKGEHIFWKNFLGYYCFLLKFQVDP
jgi:predicted Na+-dependent transporter